MTKKMTKIVTPASASVDYDALVTRAANEFAPVLQEAFPTKTALLVALDSTVLFLDTAYDAMDGKVTADHYCKHGPLAQYPDQLLSMMVLLVAGGVFRTDDPSVDVFRPDNADKWTYVRLGRK